MPNQSIRRMRDNLTVWRGFTTWRGRTRYALALARRAAFRDRDRFIDDARAIGGLFRIDGLQFDLRPDAVDWSELHPTYERQTRRWIESSVQPGGGTFIDIGAHCGVYAITFARLFERVVAFEPHPDSLLALSRNVRLNGLAEKIVCAGVAVSGFDGVAPFVVTGKETNSHLGGAHARGGLFVGVVTLDRALERVAVDADDIRLVKMDIEGGEVEALAGAVRTLRSARPFMIVEANTDTARERVGDFMSRLRYGPPVLLDRVNLCYAP